MKALGRGMEAGDRQALEDYWKAIQDIDEDLLEARHSNDFQQVEDLQEKKESLPPLKKSQKPMVVIDPGHGGIDPGASGSGDTQEKDIVLDYALALKARLLKSGRYQVELTRDDDTFVMLRKRVEIARRCGAFACQRVDRRRAGVVHHADMAVAHQPPHQVGPHAAQPHHRQLHRVDLHAGDPAAARA